jgi:hypothetical protein
MLRFEGQHALNEYYYAPKDDPYHRSRWRESYPAEEMQRLRELTAAAHNNFVDFCFAVSPGLSMVYSSGRDFDLLTAKLDSVGQLGVTSYALFLDDVPEELHNPEDKQRFATLAAAHVYVINKLYRYVSAKSPAHRLVVTPTTYTNSFGSVEYIKELGAGVDPHVDLVWTGPEVVSPEITVSQAREWGTYLRRKPLVWDNYPVNDFAPWRLFFGPLRGRVADLPSAVSGVFANPMNQAHASMIPLATVAGYLWNSAAYDPERSERQAMTDQYGKDGPSLLAPFVKSYSDYRWQKNPFEPLFIETRQSIPAGQMQSAIDALESAAAAMQNAAEFRKLLPEISPVLTKNRDRLTQVAKDPAFHHLPSGDMVWDESYDHLEARRLEARQLAQAPQLDGDFTKWESGHVYQLERSTQISSGADLWSGPSQFSLRVALGWDPQLLYVAFDVTDPALYQPFTGRDIVRGDGVDVVLEAAFRSDYYLTKAGANDYHFFFSPGDFGGSDASLVNLLPRAPGGPRPPDYRDIRTVWKRTARGFSGEVAVPASYFEGGVLREGYEIGLSFGAQKVVSAVSDLAGGEAKANRTIHFSSKSGGAFPVNPRNPATYQRLVLTGLYPAVGSAPAGQANEH